jgi:hypothetical protein
MGVSLWRSPLIGQQLAGLMDGMGHDAAQDVVEVGPGIDVAGFA